MADVLVDPAFTLGLALPDLGPPELLEEQQDGDVSTLRFRYEFTGNVDPMAERFIGSDRLAWIQELRLDRSTFTGSLHFEAEKDPRRLHGDATFTLVDLSSVAQRQIDGELVVAVPVVGRMAERRIVPGLLRRMDIEASAVDDRLRLGE